MNRTVAMAGVLALTGMLAAIGCCPSPLLMPIPVPKIALAKEAPAQVAVGQEFAYTILVTNPGDGATRHIVLTDVLPEGIKYVSSAPEAAVEGQTLRWKLGDLAGKDAKDVKTVTVKVQATRSGKFWNTADVSADKDLAAQAKAVTVASQSLLTLKVAAPEEVLLCDSIIYKALVSNPGDAPTRNVHLAMELPEGLTGEDTAAAKGDLGTLAPGASKEVSFVAKPAKPGTYAGKVGVAADGGLKAEGEAKTVVHQPVLTVTQKAPARRYANRDVSYEITVANQGDGPAQNVVVTDLMPSGIAFGSASDEGKAGGGKVVWSLGDLAAGTSRTVTLVLRAQARGTIVNTVKAAARCAEASADAQTEIEGIAAILLENWDDPDPIEVGAQTTYTVKITNQGSAEDKNIVVSCLLPAEESLVSAQGPTESTVDGQKVTFAAVKSLAPKEASVYKIVVKGLKPGDVRFKVFLTSDMMTSPVEKSESTHIYE